MPAYVVGDIHITDPAAYRAHVPVALATIARFGGHVIAGGGKLELLDGGPMPERDRHHRIPGRRDGAPLVQVGRTSGGSESAPGDLAWPGVFDRRRRAALRPARLRP